MWIHANDDIKRMYDQYDKKKSIMLWRYSSFVGKKAKKEVPAGNGTFSGSGTKHEQHMQGRSVVDSIYQQLQDKHKSYSPRKLRAWANMVHLKTWLSLDEPPNKPFFAINRKRTSIEPDPEHKQDPSKNMKLVGSPGQKVKVRSELIDQLDKFHKLKESGALSLTEYNELRGTILSDIKKL